MKLFFVSTFIRRHASVLTHQLHSHGWFDQRNLDYFYLSSILEEKCHTEYLVFSAACMWWDLLTAVIITDLTVMSGLFVM